MTDEHGLIPVTPDLIAEMRKAMAPVFEEQRQTWEREGPAATALAEKIGVTIAALGGNCPVQAEGAFDGMRFYFRARYDEWEFHAWKAEKARDYLDLDDDDEDHLIERPYGEGDFDAGWMPKHEAIGFICECVEAIRAQERDAAGSSSRS